MKQNEKSNQNNKITNWNKIKHVLKNRTTFPPPPSTSSLLPNHFLTGCYTLTDIFSPRSSQDILSWPSIRNVLYATWYLLQDGAEGGGRWWQGGHEDDYQRPLHQLRVCCCCCGALFILKKSDPFYSITVVSNTFWYDNIFLFYN